MALHCCSSQVYALDWPTYLQLGTQCLLQCLIPYIKCKMLFTNSVPTAQRSPYVYNANTNQSKHSGKRIDVFPEQGSTCVSNYCLNRDCVRYVTYPRDNSARIATRYGLDGPGIKSRWGEIICTRPDRSWGPPRLLYNGYRIFSGDKAAGK